MTDAEAGEKIGKIWNSKGLSEETKIKSAIMLLQGRQTFECTTTLSEIPLLIKVLEATKASVNKIMILVNAEVGEYKQFADYLKDNENLTSVNICFALPSDDLVQPFTKVLEENYTLTEIEYSARENLGISDETRSDFIKAIMKNPRSKMTCHSFEFFDDNCVTLACHLPPVWDQKARDLIIGHATPGHPLQKLPMDILNPIIGYVPSEIKDGEDPEQYLTDRYKELFEYHKLPSLHLKGLNLPSATLEEKIVRLEDLTTADLPLLYTGLCEAGEESKEVTKFVAYQKELQGIAPALDKQEKSSPPNSTPATTKSNSVVNSEEKQH